MQQHASGDQSRVFAFLADRATHGVREPVTRIDTHGAAVFLADQDVYKVKKAVKFPFLDFSTLDGLASANSRSIKSTLRSSILA
jgi:aminoglycoside phosphotransferase family enzyme